MAVLLLELERRCGRMDVLVGPAAAAAATTGMVFTGAGTTRAVLASALLTPDDADDGGFEGSDAVRTGGWGPEMVLRAAADVGRCVVALAAGGCNGMRPVVIIDAACRGVCPAAAAALGLGGEACDIR
jgi:hypothetical protein